MMSLFIALGAVAAFAGMAMVVVAIRHHAERLPRHTAMLIGGMIMTAFGIVIAGFALVFENTAPLALNAAGPTP